MTRRENSSKRRKAFREPRTLILIVSAKKTEPAYFSGLNRHLANPAYKLTVVGRHEDPSRLVRFASKYGSGFNHVWCVADVDEFDIAATTKLAHTSNVSLAVSNPCFEYWLLLHFEHCRAPMKRCGEDVTPRLRKHLPSYEKQDLDFGDFAEKLDDALRRAKRQCADFGGEYLTNPSTGVWALVELLMRASAQSDNPER
ncbi:RloB family protein [Nocardia sp. CS682]|uniref:RloB family protein n=1 Tax=Nocardia sp. CS682 TaxID=1047172 RepID=UPI0010751ACB|nr:RloB family protein [Nocardia sp. CS682]QBS42196.1 RloB domain-containing protein [Nocardia sp. CS682]